MLRKLVRFQANKTTKAISYSFVVFLIIFSKYSLYSGEAKKENVSAIETTALENENTELIPINIAKVLSGDTFSDKYNNQFRIAYIKEPEQSELIYNNSVDFLKALVEGKECEALLVGIDESQVPVVIVFINGIDVGALLVEYGLAYNKAALFDAEKSYTLLLNALETKAKTNNLGIWSEKNVD